MPNRLYERGRRAEYLVASKLLKQGYTVMRSAGSHGIDLLAGDAETVYGISVRIGGYMAPSELARFFALCKMFRVIPAFAKKTEWGEWTVETEAGKVIVGVLA